MNMIEDLSKAVDSYAADQVEIKVINFKEPGAHINVGEECTFSVEVKNKGHLDMKKLRLHIIGTEWADVKETGAYSAAFLSSLNDVNANTTVVFPASGTFEMKAKKATGGGGTNNEDLFSVHISTYDASLHHILNDHSHHSNPPVEKYKRHVHPS